MGGCGTTHAKTFSMAEVYALLCPHTRERRYIGFSSRSALERLKHHLSDDALGPVRDWVRALRPLEPQLEYIARGLSEGEARALELRLIRATRGLLNRPHGPKRPTRRNLTTSYDSNVTPQVDMLKWWRIQINDDLGPWYGPDLRRRL